MSAPADPASGTSGVAVRRTGIPGLLVLDLPMHTDPRGWFKENWQREKMVAAGLPDFGPVQHSVAYNERAGVIRGIHAEPWDKLVSLANGRAFGAWVDLREGPTFGRVHTEELDPSTAVFVPRGVGNGYQTLSDGVAYSYLVNEHWRPDAAYSMLNLADETIAIDWPIPPSQARISDKDRAYPRLDDVTTVPPPRTLILGPRGQVGQELMALFPGATGLTRDELDLADPAAVAAYEFSGVEVVINAAAFTAVDAAETPEGRRAAWTANAASVAALARQAVRHRFTLVHFSTDYVYDGTETMHTEGEPLAPLSVYGQSKAAGELAVSVVPAHYLIRTSWVVGRGKNFLRTMVEVAASGASPQVVDDQVGRLTSAADLAAAVRHLLDSRAPFGAYAVSGQGEPMSWAQIAKTVFKACGRSEDEVHAVDSPTYANLAEQPIADRPASSVLDLGPIQETGFEPQDQASILRQFHR